jgi:hypothetical protein
MSKQFNLRHTALAVSALVGLISVATVQTAAAADKAKTKAAGTYVTGDFHNHSTCSDGQISMQKLTDKSVKTYGLDWFVHADHGGSSARNCTLREDPFEPVTPALGLTTSPTGPYPPATFPPGAPGLPGGQPAATLKGPNQSWESTLPGGRAAIKGDGTATPKAMWRWQEIQEFQYKVAEDESRARQKPIWIGVEQNNPGHEHTSMTILQGQRPWPQAGVAGNANLQAQYEYCFDRRDTDTSRGAQNQWDCSVADSEDKNALIDATAKKIVGSNGVASATNAPDRGHFKTMEGIRWMKEKAPTTSYFVPAHVERAGKYDPVGNRGFNIEHLRNFNNVAKDIAFGFESMPGHQASENRGEYRAGFGGPGIDSVGVGTYGGTGIYAARIGGVWDALLGEGRNWWFFASSDYHNRGSFGPDQLETDQDFYPGEYQKQYVMVRKGTNNLTAEGIIDGLRSGNSFAGSGDLIDRLAFVACAANPAIPAAAFKTLVEKAAMNAAAKNAEVRIDGCATMGEKLVVAPGADVVVSIAVRDPQGKNYSPYSFPNPSLKQIGITQPLNQPVLDHIDVIGANVTGFVSPTDTAKYAGLEGSAAASNSSAAIKKVFNSKNWTAAADGMRVMSYRIPAVKVSQYVRLRGTNLPAATPFETDANGNPLNDYDLAPQDDGVTATIPGKVKCDDAACPAHMRTVNGVKYSTKDVAGWADLWFYSNPVFIEVTNSVKVAGAK